MHGPDADGEKGRRTRQQRAGASAPRLADACGQAEARISSQDRDRYRERDEIGIVSFEHDLAGCPSSRDKPPPAAEFTGTAAGMTIDPSSWSRLWHMVFTQTRSRICREWEPVPS